MEALASRLAFRGSLSLAKCSVRHLSIACRQCYSQGQTSFTANSLGRLRSYTVGRQPMQTLPRVSAGRHALPLRSTIGWRRTMYIQTESTPNESALKFIPGVTVLPSGTAEFVDSRAAMASPLAKRLFQIDGVKSVFYGPDFITISKDDDANWQLMKPDIYAGIMDFFASGNAVVDDEGRYGGNSDTEILDDDSENVAMIKELLETRVRPAIQEDGGDIEFRGFDEETGTVKLKLKGACRDCSSSVVTLKNGIQSMLSHYIPAVNSVDQVIDAEESISNAEFAKLEQKLNASKERQAHSS